MQLLKIHTVLERCAISRATLYREIKKGNFPEPVSLTGNGRAVAWRKEDIDQWIIERAPVALFRATLSKGISL